MSSSCHRHVWEIAEATCEGCGLGYCESCLFYVGESAERPMCVPCALARAGVRGARKPRVPRRQRRAMAEQAKRANAVEQPAVAADAEERRHVEASAGSGSWARLDTSHWDVHSA